MKQTRVACWCNLCSSAHVLPAVRSSHVTCQWQPRMPQITAISEHSGVHNSTIPHHYSRVSLTGLKRDVPAFSTVRLTIIWKKLTNLRGSAANLRIHRIRLHERKRRICALTSFSLLYKTCSVLRPASLSNRRDAPHHASDTYTKPDLRLRDDR